MRRTSGRTHGLAVCVCAAAAAATVPPATSPTHAYIDILCCELMHSMLKFITVKDGFMECAEAE